MRILVSFVLLLSVSCALGRSLKEQARIDYLIESLGELDGAVFIRNGLEHNAAAAQSHLQQKLRFAGERIQTAEQFIKYCASESSITHKPYQVRFADGRVQNTADYFEAKLREYDQKKN